MVVSRKGHERRGGRGTITCSRNPFSRDGQTIFLLIVLTRALSPFSSICRWASHPHPRPMSHPQYTMATCQNPTPMCPCPYRASLRNKKRPQHQHRRTIPDHTRYRAVEPYMIDGGSRQGITPRAPKAHVRPPRLSLLFCAQGIPHPGDHRRGPAVRGAQSQYEFGARRGCRAPSAPEGPLRCESPSCRDFRGKVRKRNLGQNRGEQNQGQRCDHHGAIHPGHHTGAHPASTMQLRAMPACATRRVGALGPHAHRNVERHVVDLRRRGVCSKNRKTTAATTSTTPACLLLGSANAETTPAGTSDSAGTGPAAMLLNTATSLYDIPWGCCFFTGPWTVARSSLRMLCQVVAFCRPLQPVFLLVSFPW